MNRVVIIYFKMVSQTLWPANGGVTTSTLTQTLHSISTPPSYKQELVAVIWKKKKGCSHTTEFISAGESRLARPSPASSGDCPRSQPLPFSTSGELHPLFPTRDNAGNRRSSRQLAISLRPHSSSLEPPPSGLRAAAQPLSTAPAAEDRPLAVHNAPSAWRSAHRPPMTLCLIAAFACNSRLLLICSFFSKNPVELPSPLTFYYCFTFPLPFFRSPDFKTLFCHKQVTISFLFCFVVFLFFFV